MLVDAVKCESTTICVVSKFHQQIPILSLHFNLNVCAHSAAPHYKYIHKSGEYVTAYAVYNEMSEICTKSDINLQMFN